MYCQWRQIKPKSEFLCITLDSVLMQASLPQDKLTRIREAIKSWSVAAFFSKRDLLSLLGHLNFAMCIIPQGRSFVSRLLVLAKSVQNRDTVVLDEGCHSDLRFWGLLCDEWNGISFFYNDFVESSDSLQFFTDAAPSASFGEFYINECRCLTTWNAVPWQQTQINCPLWALPCCRCLFTMGQQMDQETNYGVLWQSCCSRNNQQGAF